MVNCGSDTWTQNFSYDAMGNINKQGAGNTTSYSAAYSETTNQVSAGAPAGYDANGNQRSSTGLSSISWNANGQPITVQALSGGAISGTYDALGRLVENGSGSAYTQFVFSPSGQKIASVQAGTLLKATIPLPGGATAIYSGTSGMPYIRHLDWLGSARLSTTWSHTVQSKVAYAPFGETYNEAGASSNDRSFTGQEQDTVPGNAATGIYDFLFRKYDPAAGRWLSPDPSGWKVAGEDHPQSLNRYSYAQNNPLNLADPNGLDCIYASSSGVSVSSFDSQASCAFYGGTWFQGTLPSDSEFWATSDDQGNPMVTMGIPGYASEGGTQLYGLPLGQYAFFGCDPSTNYICGLMYNQAMSPPPQWTYYVDAAMNMNYGRSRRTISRMCFTNVALPTIESDLDPSSDDVNPFTVSGEAGMAGLAASASEAQSGAFLQAAGAYSVGRGLTVPLRSSAVRAGLDAAQQWHEIAGDLIELQGSIVLLDVTINIGKECQ